jgi:hypothetical protein
MEALTVASLVLAAVSFGVTLASFILGVVNRDGRRKH